MDEFHKKELDIMGSKIKKSILRPHLMTIEHLKMFIKYVLSHLDDLHIGL